MIPLTSLACARLGMFPPCRYASMLRSVTPLGTRSHTYIVCRGTGPIKVSQLPVCSYINEPDPLLLWELLAFQGRTTRTKYR